MPTRTHLLRPSRAARPKGWALFGLIIAASGCQGSAADADVASSASNATSADALTASITGPINPQKDSGKCLDVNMGNQNNGAAVQIATCYGDAAQTWTFTGSQLKVFDNKCLDVTNGTQANGVLLQIWECDSNNTNQKWTRNGQTFVWRNTYCLDLKDGNTADLTRVQIWACGTSNANQEWTTTAAATTTTTTTTASTTTTTAATTTTSSSGTSAANYSSSTPGASSSALTQPSNSLSVLDYGVKNDGTTDNTTTLQTAFDTAASQGKIAWLPAGTYNHSGVIKANGVKVMGAGQTTILRATAQANSAFVLTGTSPALSNVFTQVAAANRSSQPYDCGVLIIASHNASVSYVSVQGASANGIRIDSSDTATITKNFVNGSNADGVAIVNGSTNNVISNTQVSNASDDSFSSDSYPGEKQNSGNTFTNCFAGPNYKQGRSYALMGSADETIKDSVSKGSLWHGIVAGTDPSSTTQSGYGFTITNNLVLANASGLPVMITEDGGLTATTQSGVATVSGTMTSGDPASVIGWAPITNVADPSTFSTYTGGGPGSSNTAGDRQ